ncbi:MAG: PilT/PilU family type 4a pilus ATPase [Candidatus Omnitrophota bacterium]|nr:PilT/PilU family type 4a pilus ATPase [Candidatus Omnitrophota bacterium]
MQEKRKTPTQGASRDRRPIHRTNIRCQATYQLMQNGRPEGSIYPATTVDISSRGVLLRTGQPAGFGSLVQVRLQIELPGSKEYIRATGPVVRVQEEKTGHQYLLGVAFETLVSPEQLAVLRRLETLDLKELLNLLCQMKASDLHLTTNQVPHARVKGRLVPMKWPVFQPGEIQALIYGTMLDSQIAAFEKNRELDFAFSLSSDKRFRINLHWQQGHVEAAIRLIQSQHEGWKALGRPSIVGEWSRRSNGLILIVGPTGCGKTTTLNAMIHQINQERDAVVICLERPIEYIHQSKKSLIKQREVGSDTLSYPEAVRRALRQDPDVIVVGEVEDAETVQVVLNAAETGTLVLASFHATNTVQAIDRFLGLCPESSRRQATLQLANCLQGILTQYLIPKEEAMGGDLTLATEVFVPTSAARNMIRGGNLEQILTLLQTGRTQGMYSIEQSLRQLVVQGLIMEETAKNYLSLIGEASASR